MLQQEHQLSHYANSRAGGAACVQDVRAKVFKGQNAGSQLLPWTPSSQRGLPLQELEDDAALHVLNE